MGTILKEGNNSMTSLSVDAAYKELGSNYRYYLGWRHKIFAGYLTSLAALGVGIYQDAAHEMILLCAGMALSGVFLALDLRNRDLYNACFLSGLSLEHLNKDLRIPGTYTMLDFTYRARKFNSKKGNRPAITQSRAIDGFGAVVIGFLIGRFNYQVLAWRARGGVYSTPLVISLVLGVAGALILFSIADRRYGKRLLQGIQCEAERITAQSSATAHKPGRN